MSFDKREPPACGPADELIALARAKRDADAYENVDPKRITQLRIDEMTIYRPQLATSLASKSITR